MILWIEFAFISERFLFSMNIEIREGPSFLNFHVEQSSCKNAKTKQEHRGLPISLL
jgi:hypothetical protein